MEIRVEKKKTEKKIKKTMQMKEKKIKLKC